MLLKPENGVVNKADESKSNNLTVSAVYFYLQIKQMETEQVINDFHGDIFFI